MTCGATPNAAMPLATDRRMSCQVNGAIGTPAFEFRNACLKLSLARAKTRDWTPAGGVAEDEVGAREARQCRERIDAGNGNGSACSLAFFTFAAGNSHVPCATSTRPIPRPQLPRADTPSTAQSG